MSEANNRAQRPQFTTYYWRHGFVMLAPSFQLDRSQNPYRRLAATLMFSLRKPFTLETGTAEQTETRAVLIAPKVLRRRIYAFESDIVICDMSIATPEYLALAPLLKGTSVRELDPSLLAPFSADFEIASRGALDGASLRDLLHRVIFSFTGQKPQPPKFHPRIVQVLKLIEEQPMSVVNLSWLAERVHLSPSRLRHLFQEQTGSSLTHYLRWNTVWKGIWLWSPGQPLIEVVKAVGYHDRAHLNRAFNEVFGMNPSTFFHPDQVRLIRCDWD